MHPEDYDFSEQRFEASLAASGLQEEIEAREQERALPTSAKGGQMWGTGEQAWNLVAGVAPAVKTPAVARQEEPNPVDETPYWREEVTSRVESYRARRKRPPCQRSLSLDFERAVNRSSVFSLQPSEEGPASPAEPLEALNAGSASADAPTEDQQPSTDNLLQPDDRRLTAEDSNLIEFPRLAPMPVMPPAGEELAETVIDKPRILDAPEAVETSRAPLGGISLGPEEENAPAVEFELPMSVAPMSQRVFAGLVDALLVLLGSALFLLIVMRNDVGLPAGKGGTILLLAAPVLFWAVFEYLFLVHAGATPGMRMAKLELVSFEGGPVGRRVRRGRALAMVLSCLSLGLGLFWALLDEDTLCWHDRISRTYVVSSW